MDPFGLLSYVLTFFILCGFGVHFLLAIFLAIPLSFVFQFICGILRTIFGLIILFIMGPRN